MAKPAIIFFKLEFHKSGVIKIAYLYVLSELRLKNRRGRITKRKVYLRNQMAVIFQTYSVAEAHLKVHVTKNSGLADLFVYSVSSVGRATGDSIWYMTESRARATSRIYLSALAEAALVVFFVDAPAKAGWRKARKLSRAL